MVTRIPKGFFGISSQSIIDYEEAKTYIGSEEDHISFICKDGYKTSMPIKEYILFIVLNGIIPSECTKEELEQKSLGMRL
jgi:hypothetical protein